MEKFVVGAASGNTLVTSKVAKVPISDWKCAEVRGSALPEAKGPLHGSKMTISAQIWHREKTSARNLPGLS